MAPVTLIATEHSTMETEVPEETTFKHFSTTKLQKARAKAACDFRSDVVTVPTESMIQAILDASFGDDIYDAEGDESVNALQDKVAELTGKEAALWAMSGTMGNQICLRTHLTQPPHSVLLDHRAHVQCWESGALPVFSQATVTAVAPANGIHLTLDDVKRNMIAGENIHFPPTRVVSLENTLSGTILPLKDAKEISGFVRSFPVSPHEKSIAMHLDGARIFDAVVAEGVDLKEYCACFDSVSLCLAKGVGSAMGSIIVGSKDFIERAKWFRKMFGGGTRQPGMMAAAANAALDHSLPRLANVHKLTRNVARQLEAIGYKFALPVQTNMIVLDLEAEEIPAAAMVDYCKRHGITVFGNGRVVFHHQVSNEAATRLVSALRELRADKLAGVSVVNSVVVGGCA